MVNYFLYQASEAQSVVNGASRRWAYADLKSGSITVDTPQGPQTISVQLIKVPHNTRDDWMKATSKRTASDGPPDAISICKIYEIDLRHSTDTDTEIQNLQYFFLRADRISSLTDSGPRALLIHIGVADRYRVQAFLAFQTGEDSPYGILLCDENNMVSSYWKRTELNAIGRLFPLLRVTAGPAQRTGEIQYSDLVMQCNQSPQENQHPAFAMVQVYRQRIKDQLSGTPENPLFSKKKSELLSSLDSYIDKKRDYINHLTEICWMQYLYFMVEEKKLLKTTIDPLSQKKEWNLDIAALDRSWLDCVTYSEGILQLLENSCQHTEKKAGYLTLRIHYTDRNAPESKLLNVATTRERLRKRYQAIGGIDSWPLMPDAQFYLEITVIDDALGKREDKITSPRRGITPVYVENMLKRNAAKEDELKGITLLDIVNNSTKCAQNHQTLVHHYGIAALRLTAARNNGGFIVSSPASLSEQNYETVCCVPNENINQLIYRKKTGVFSLTEYYVLFPLGQHEILTNTNPRTNVIPDIFDRKILSDVSQHRVTTKRLVLTDQEEIKEIPSYLKPEEKESKTEALAKLFERELTPPANANEHTIFLLDVCHLKSMDIELVTKALFQTILSRSEIPPSSGEQLYALYFSNVRVQWEVIRLFSIFYNRTFSSEPNQSLARQLSNVQIALCSPSEQLNVPEVNLLLQGNSMGSLFETARRFAYYNSESAIPLLSQIKYLSYEITDTYTPLAPFPFDLWLCDPMGCDDSETKIAPQYDCWFLRRISRLLQTDLQQEELGLKISNVHSHLQSAIHISDFYEAELLFHNIGILARFAYLITRRILENCQINNKILVVNYEPYSKLLAEYVTQYLKEACRDCELEIYNAMVYMDGNREYHLMPENEFAEKNATLRRTFLNNCDYITLCPIGSTLGTIHRMYECIQKETGMLPLPIRQIANVVLILVGNSPKTGELDISSRYWKKISPQKNKNCGAGSYSSEQLGQVTVWRPDDNSTLSVDYFLYPTTHWHDPTDNSSDYSCANMSREQALVYADESATSLNMIFPLKAKSTPFRLVHEAAALISDSEKESNDTRLKCLKDCVSIGHIAQGSNHFSFYLDIPRYFRNVRHQIPATDDASFDSWLKKLHKQHFDPNAFNIIVTPLKKINVSFVKELIDKVFEHSSRILHIDLQNAQRGDIRAKYSFITQDYRRLKAECPEIKINAYYVDDSLVTADTLQRGRSMLRMLLEDETSFSGEEFLFKGVFLLISRSSRDTIRDFVKNPEQDFSAFATLCIPHFNTKNNYCPACRRHERYRQLSARSVTNLFNEEYQRLDEKHSLRQTKEFREWQINQLLFSPTSYARLRQWLAHSATAENSQDERIKIVKNIMENLEVQFFREFWARELQTAADVTEKEKVQTLISRPDLQQKFLRTMSMATLHSHMKQAGFRTWTNEQREAFEFVWFDHVLAERSYRRAISAHEAYCKLHLEREKTDSQWLENAILGLLKTESPILSENDTVYDKWEWRYSCIKVLSRDYILRHHEVYEFMFDFLRDIENAMLGIGSDTSRTEWLKITSEKIVPSLTTPECKEIDPLLRYQMVISILHLLADMQSNYPIRQKTLSDLNQSGCRMTKMFFDWNISDPKEKLHFWFLNTIPCEEQIAFDYEKCVKLAALSNDEESKCLLIQRECN